MGLRSLIERLLFIVAIVGALYHLYLIIHPYTPISYWYRIGVFDLTQLQRGTHVFFILIVGFLLSYLTRWSISSMGLRWILTLVLAIVSGFIAILSISALSSRGALESALMVLITWVLSMVLPLARPLARRAPLEISDIVLAVLSFIPYLYLVYNYQDLIYRAVLPEPMDIAMGWAMAFMLMGLVLRLVGPEMPILVCAFILYDIYGYLLPRPWFHPGFDAGFLAGKLYIETEAALLGTVTGVSAKYVVYFTILSGLLGALGYGGAMARVFLSLLGRSPASVGRATVGLGIGMGMVSGSGAADTAFIGSTMKPLYRAAGYRDLDAAGLAANAGTLAYITPPILGSVAFLMVELLGIPYTWVIIMSIGPALLYAISILLYNEFYVRKTGIKPVDTKLGKRFSSSYVIPFIPPMIILTIISLGYSITLAVFISIILAPIIAILDKGMRNNLRKIPEGLAEGLKLLVPVGASIVMANLIMAMVVVSGLHQKFALALLQIVGGNLVYAVLFAFFFSLLLGMGVPPIATYTLASLLTAPTIIKLAAASGIPEEAATLATHMFLFYCAMLADITPPVALSAFAAAAVFGSDPIKVGVRASMVALPKYLYATSFIWSYWGTGLLVLPITLTMHTTEAFALIATRFAAVLAGVVFISAANSGYLGCSLSMSPRILLVIFGIMLVIPSEILNIVGLIGGLSTALLSMRLGISCEQK
ncbi:MAG: TRAP transporter fused permease subunit [Desulfurococcales archaeon]|nr:TRAP transporter fused permease subunit [Desulfurococcales archaeon]